jgi:hypothetical protein
LSLLFRRILGKAWGKVDAMKTEGGKPDGVI